MLQVKPKNNRSDKYKNRQPMIDKLAKVIGSELDAIVFEKDIYNQVIKTCREKQIIKRWSNPCFDELYQKHINKFIEESKKGKPHIVMSETEISRQQLRETPLQSPVSQTYPVTKTEPSEDEIAVNETVDILQISMLDTLYEILSCYKEEICKQFKEYWVNYSKEGGKKKCKNKGGPCDNWFERCLRVMINKYSYKLEPTYDYFNEFVVPDIVECLKNCVLCIDGKTNCGDGDRLSNKIHLGVNQSNLGDKEFIKFVTKDPSEKWGIFKGNISSFYKGLPTLTYVVKLVYNHSEDTAICKEIQIFLIPHKDTFSRYQENIKRGGNKSKEEQRLEINDDRLVRTISLTETSSSSESKTLDSIQS